MREIQTGLHKPEGGTKQRLTKSADNSAPVCFPNCASICLGSQVSFDLPFALQNFGPVFTAPRLSTPTWSSSREARRGQALRLIAIRQARLKPLALSASNHESMVNGRAAASGEERINLSAGIARLVVY